MPHENVAFVPMIWERGRQVFLVKNGGSLELTVANAAGQSMTESKNMEKQLCKINDTQSREKWQPSTEHQVIKSMTGCVSGDFRSNAFYTLAERFCLIWML